MRSRMVRSIEEERVYGETRWDVIQWVGLSVPGSARRRNGRFAAVANGRLGGRPCARRSRTTARLVSLSRRVDKSGAPVKRHGIMRPQYLNLPQPALQLVPTRENAARRGPRIAST